MVELSQSNVLQEVRDPELQGGSGIVHVATERRSWATAVLTLTEFDGSAETELDCRTWRWLIRIERVSAFEMYFVVTLVLVDLCFSSRAGLLEI